MSELISKTLGAIQPVLQSDLDRAQEHLDSLTKPPGSLGMLEKLGQRYAAIKGTHTPRIEQKSILVFAADHGVTEEGVSAYPSEVTPQMVFNFLSEGAAINVLARQVAAEVIIIDIGVNHQFDSCPGLVHRKIAMGTWNMTRGPAMSRQQAQKALETGIHSAQACIQKGTDILGTGDMGIGNSTSAAAIMSVLGGKDPEETAGRGTGINEDTLKKKIKVIERAIENNQPDPDDPIDVLAKVGGFEIGGIAGTILGAAAGKTPVVIDGLISGAGAALALKLNKKVSDYIFTSHRSREPGHEVIFELLDQSPLFDLGMRLGEGTGAALGISLLEAGARIYSEMETFQQAGVTDKTISS